MLKKITRSPYLNLLSGTILLITAGYETFAVAIEETATEASVGAHHGILVFAIIHIAKSIPEIMHSLKEFEEADKVLQEEKASN
jgi:hypothetical protein